MDRGNFCDGQKYYSWTGANMGMIHLENGFTICELSDKCVHVLYTRCKILLAGNDQATTVGDHQTKIRFSNFQTILDVLECC